MAQAALLEMLALQQISALLAEAHRPRNALARLETALLSALASRSGMMERVKLSHEVALAEDVQAQLELALHHRSLLVTSETGQPWARAFLSVMMARELVSGGRRAPQAAEAAEAAVRLASLALSGLVPRLVSAFLSAKHQQGVDATVIESLQSCRLAESSQSSAAMLPPRRLPQLLVQ